jgi:hypothetical protein
MRRALITGSGQVWFFLAELSCSDREVHAGWYKRTRASERRSRARLVRTQAIVDWRGSE